MLVSQRAAIEKEAVPRFPRRRDKLVHDAASHADKLVFRPLAQPGFLRRLDAEAEKPVEQGDGRHFQGRRRAETRTLGHVPGDHGVKAAQAVPRLLQDIDHASHVVAPRRLRVFFDPA